MSGLSKIFKFPGVIKKRRAVGHELPTFDLGKVTNLRELGFGSFGSVHLGNYVCSAGIKSVVVKKLRGESEDAKRRFLKEAKLLNSIKHPNVPSFLGFSDIPYALMMEYVAFDFAPFGVEKILYSLEDFYHFIDCEFDFQTFSDVLTVCMRDVVKGLDFLHGIEIAHRDLKPSNILVSNQHYAQKEESVFEKEYQACPVVCKVADFGLSRSLNAQTQTVLHTRTDDIHRGTPVYMAPEIQTGALTTATQSDLKKMDMWSLGILAHAMMNPNLSYPYCKEAEQVDAQFSMDMMKHFMQLQQLPSNDTKYESYRIALWWQIEEVFSTCTKFDPNCRPSASEILSKVNIDDPEASLLIHPLRLHQSSALEDADAILAHRLHVESSTTCRELETQAPLDDGTNACSFVAIATCDAFLDKCQNVNEDQCLSWNDLAATAENIMMKLPRKINELRDSSQIYGPSEAKRILESNGLLRQQYDLSEECVSGSGVFSEAGRNEIFKALGNISPDIKDQVGVYTCTPYAFTVGLHNDSFFLVDSHPVGEELGGNGNGILVATPDRSSRSCRLIVQWILKRLWLSGVDKKMPQSLAWLSVIVVPSSGFKLENNVYLY